MFFLIVISFLLLFSLLYSLLSFFTLFYSLLSFLSFSLSFSILFSLSLSVRNLDSSLSVSRIGSNAQCKLMKVVSVGIKNELTNYRIMELSSNSFDFFKLLSFNLIFFQDHLSISSIETSLILLPAYRNGILFKTLFELHIFLPLFASYSFRYYLIFIPLNPYSSFFYVLPKSFVSFFLSCFHFFFINLFNNHYTLLLACLFNNHYTFYISYLGMNYSNVIGFRLFLVYFLQFISGLLLSSLSINCRFTFSFFFFFIF